MVGDPYQTVDDPHCYPGTQLLRNIPDFRDEAALEAFEVEMVALRTEEGVPEGSLSPAHYRDLHRHMFQDVYPWAGNYRIIRTGKGGNWFCFPENIDQQMATLFEQLDTPNFQPGSDAYHFIPALAHFIGDLNAIHPFREGNGRTQLIFLRLLGQKAGHLFRMEAIEADEFLAAMIASFGGNMDALIDELERMLA
jgi:cell filamentation protein